MARRVFVHIGAPKSGTSYLQDRLGNNRELITEQGLTYPELRVGDHFEAALDLIERPWAGQLKRAKGQWQALADAVAGVEDDAVISHEILAAATPEQVARAHASLGDAEVHVVLTVRDLARQIPAEWQEMVKHRATMHFDAFAERVMGAARTTPDLWFWRVQSVPDVLTRWGTGLTPDQVHVVTVPPAGASSQVLWDRFASVLGLKTGIDYAPSELVNASLGVAEVAVLRRLNRRLRRAKVSRETYVTLVRELIARDVFGAHEASEPAALPARLRPFVDEVAGEWVDWVEGSGVDVVGDLANLRPTWSEEPARHPDRPAAGQVASSAIEALAAVLIEVDQRPLPELGRQARRIRRRILGS